MTSPSPVSADAPAWRLTVPANIRFPMERANGIQILHTCAALGERLAGRGGSVRLLVRGGTPPPPPGGPDSGPAGRRSVAEVLGDYGLPAEPPGLRIARLPVLHSRNPRVWNASFVGAATASVLGRTALARLARRPTAILTRGLREADLAVRLWPAMGRRVLYEAHTVAALEAERRHEWLRGADPVPPERVAGIARREQRILRGSDRVLALTDALGDMLAEASGDPDFARRCATVPDAAPARLLDREPVPWDERPPGRVLYLGSLHPWKGAGTAVAAARDLAEGGADVTLHVVGGALDAGDREDLEALRAAAGPETVFTGLLPHREVDDELRAARVGLVPLPDNLMARAFTSPLKLFEYLAAGVPVVASDLPSLREVVTDGQTALLTPPGDAAAMAAAVRRVLGDPGLAGALAEAGRERAAEFTYERRAERILAALDSCEPSSR